MNRPLKVATRFSELTLFLILLLLLGIGSLQSSGKEASASLPQAAEIKLIVTVVDDHERPVSGLPQTAFTVMQDKAAQGIVSFTDQNSPASVAIVIDLSSSMNLGGSGARARSAIAAQALTQLVRTSPSINEYFIIGFNDDSVTLLDGVRDAQKAILALDRIQGLNFQGHSALFDTCYAAIGKLKRGFYQKRLLLLVTDGEDTYSRADLKDVRDALRESNIVVYSLYVGLDPEQRPYSQPAPRGIVELKKLSSTSGGRVVQPADGKDLLSKVQELATEINSQYVIGFAQPDFFVAGKCYSIKVKVVPPASGPKKVSVRSQESVCLSAKAP